jgi:hypothetical protein
LAVERAAASPVPLAAKAAAARDVASPSERR